MRKDPQCICTNTCMYTRAHVKAYVYTYMCTHTIHQGSKFGIMGFRQKHGFLLFVFHATQNFSLERGYYTVWVVYLILVTQDTVLSLHMLRDMAGFMSLHCRSWVGMALLSALDPFFPFGSLLCCHFTDNRDSEKVVGGNSVMRTVMFSSDHGSPLTLHLLLQHWHMTVFSLVKITSMSRLRWSAL